jgi:hypothetical protein
MFSIAEDDSNISIENVIFDANNDGQDNMSAAGNYHAAIGLGHRSGEGASNVTIRNCVFIDWGRAFWMRMENNGGAVLRNVLIEDNVIIPRVRLPSPTQTDQLEAVAFDIDIADPDSIIGMVIRNNLIIDNGIHTIRPYSSTQTKYDAQFPVSIVTGSNIFDTIIEGNIVDVVSDTTKSTGAFHGRQDTVWTDYSFSGNAGGVSFLDEFYDIAELKTNLSKVGVHEFGTDGDLPSWAFDDIGAEGDGTIGSGTPNIVVDSDDNVHVTFYDAVGIGSGPDIMHVEKHWRKENLSSEVVVDDGVGTGGGGGDPTTWVSNGTNLVIDNSDGLHTFYWNLFEGIFGAGYQLTHTYETTPGNWTKELTGVMTHSGDNLGGEAHNDKAAVYMRYDAADTFMVAYTNTTTDSLSLVRGTTGSWTDANLYYGGSGASNPSHGAIAAVADSVYLAWLSNNSGGTATYLVYAKSTDRGITWPGTPATGDTAYTFPDAAGHGPVDIELDVDAIPFIAFGNNTSDSIYVANRIGGTWQIEGVGLAGNNDKNNFSLEYNSVDSTMYLAYRVQTSASYHWINLARREGTDNWSIIHEIDDRHNTGQFPALAFDSNGKWWIAHWEEDAGETPPRGNDGDDLFRLTTNKNAFFGQGVYYFNDDLDRGVVFDGTRMDTLGSYTHDRTWSVTWSDTTVDSPGEYISLGHQWTKNTNGDGAYILPWDAEVLLIQAGSEDTTDVFSARLFENYRITPSVNDLADTYTVNEDFDNTDLITYGWEHVINVQGLTGNFVNGDSITFTTGGGGANIDSVFTSGAFGVFFITLGAAPEPGSGEAFNNEDRTGAGSLVGTIKDARYELYFTREWGPYQPDRSYREPWYLNKGDALHCFIRVVSSNEATNPYMTVHFRRRH